MNLDDFKLYLPKYLSSQSEKELFKSLKDFPDNIDSRFYTNYLQNQNILFQGDGLNRMLVINLPDKRVDYAPCMVISNTCDIDTNHKRFFSSQITYAPIIKLAKYQKYIISKTDKTSKQIESHIDSIKKQEITQIFYLPKAGSLQDESIVFLDRLNNHSNKSFSRENLNEKKLFTLSDYGFYVFLIKLSIHFTRVQEKVERKSLNT